MADEILAKALGAIGRKERTVAEMREWLEVRDVESDEIDRVVNFLIENEALDDRKFAFAYTSDKRELAGWGRTRIRETLRKRGLAKDLIEEALDQDGGESEVDRAARVLDERGADLSDDRGRSRALGLLARRGYSAEEAYAAIRRKSSVA
ncbi:MAG TPA: regulatory protein RecX [Solirubrobacterales bacterium]|nr:regulatory protein RecX [Solirubrobacterales bacterium]